jgi:hypothetical protein
LDLALQRFLKKFPFASPRVMAGHFSMDRATINSILDRDPRLRKLLVDECPMRYRSNRN